MPKKKKKKNNFSGSCANDKFCVECSLGVNIQTQSNASKQPTKTKQKQNNPTSSVCVQSMILHTVCAPYNERRSDGKVLDTLCEGVSLKGDVYGSVTFVPHISPLSTHTHGEDTCGGAKQRECIMCNTDHFHNGMPCCSFVNAPPPRPPPHTGRRGV